MRPLGKKGVGLALAHVLLINVSCAAGPGSTETVLSQPLQEVPTNEVGDAPQRPHSSAIATLTVIPQSPPSSRATESARSVYAATIVLDAASSANLTSGHAHKRAGGIVLILALSGVILCVVLSLLVSMCISCGCWSKLSVALIAKREAMSIGTCDADHVQATRAEVVMGPTSLRIC